MTWSTLPAYSDGNALTAAQVTAIKDNINETAPAKATTAGRLITTNGANSVAEREMNDDIINTTGTRTSSSYGNLTSGGAGPTVTVSTSVNALTMVNVRMENSGNNACWCSFAISGATTDASIDQRAAMAQAGSGDANRFGVSSFNAVTAGSNTFQNEYRVTAGTGTFQDRRLVVMAL